MTKRYDDYSAVDDISFDVRQGEIFGIVGHNGAGKTSAVESIIGLHWPFEGEVRALGLPPTANANSLRSTSAFSFKKRSCRSV